MEVGKPPVAWPGRGRRQVHSVQEEWGTIDGHTHALHKSLRSLRRCCSFLTLHGLYGVRDKENATSGSAYQRVPEPFLTQMRSKLVLRL
jgi:hypothetical protein